MADTPNAAGEDVSAVGPPPEEPLPAIEEVVTEELIRSVVEAKDADLELVDFVPDLGSQIGDNYMSIMYCAKINVKSKTTGARDTMSVMLKTIPRNAFRKQMINECKAFEKEAKVYDQVLKDFYKFQQEKGLEEDQIFKNFPACYKSHIDQDTDYICLQDLRPSGFQMANRISGLDEVHTHLVMKSLARFHAVSFSIFHGDFDKIQETYPFLEETMFKRPEEVPDMHKIYMSQTFKMEGEELRKVGLNEEATRVENVYDEQYFTRLRSLAADRVPNAVIGHGDCWTNNFLFKYDEETGKPVDLKFIDFQLSRVSSRAIDLNYFLYTSPQLSILNNQEDALLKIYHDEFTQFAGKLGYVNDELTFEVLKDEFQRARPYGITMGLMLAPMLSANKQDIPDMENMEFDPESSDVKDLTSDFMGKFMNNNGLVVSKLVNFAKVHIPKCPNTWTSKVE